MRERLDELHRAACGFDHSWSENVARFCPVALALEQLVTEAERRIDELVEALALYGEHEIGCPGWFRAIGAYQKESHETRPCDCGLDEIMRRGE